ncbi:meiotic recombination protein REC8 homolog [Cuculus canorus]|uniref:meiotic recombination protein REC8 homolog n=1 Tax=Cuculus canorus TaxID=55661 RepID=UPI0023AA2E20|nr:meiotic recombination protein REC8 homolog [Cuculus canorus]
MAPPPRPTAPPELPSVEILREVLEPSLVTLPSSELTLEVVEEEPRPWVPSLEERAPPPLDLEALRRRVALGVRQPEGTELGALLPHGASRSLAARLFALCLALCASAQVSLFQPRPFGPIALRSGPRGPPPL